MCTTCQASCCHDMEVEVSVPDLIRLGLLNESEASTDFVEAVNRLKKRGIIRSFRTKDFVAVLEQKKNGDCIFLSKDRRCKVYEKRPEICRQFPKLGPNPNHCPYIEKPIEVRVPSTWVKYEPSLCKGCWAGCCTLPVKVSSEDLYHMGFLKNHEVNGPLAKIAKCLMEKGIVKSFHLKTRVFTLQTKNGTDCVFLGPDRLCTIYEQRPSVCRRFPENSARRGFCPAIRR
jgi:Fe-S-cluster containining protein